MRWKIRFVIFQHAIMTPTNKASKNDEQYVLELRDTDRLLGRGASGVNFAGNRFFRAQIDRYLELYTQASTHTGRNAAVQMVMDAVQKNGGRFLVKINIDEANSLGYSGGQEVYRIVSDDFAMNTVKQAFRDAINKPQANKLRDRSHRVSAAVKADSVNYVSELSSDVRNQPKTNHSTVPSPSERDLLNQLLASSSEQEIRKQLALRNALLQELAVRQYQESLAEYLCQQTLQARLAEPHLASSSTPTCSFPLLAKNSYVGIPVPVVYHNFPGLSRSNTAADKERGDDAASLVSDDRSPQASVSGEPDHREIIVSKFGSKRKHSLEGQQVASSKIPKN
jgi:hypothetical protein